MVLACPKFPRLSSTAQQIVAFKEAMLQIFGGHPAPSGMPSCPTEPLGLLTDFPLACQPLTPTAPQDLLLGLWRDFYSGTKVQAGSLHAGDDTDSTGAGR